MSRAAWTLALGRRSVGADGTVRIEGSLSDRGVKQADLTIEVTPDRKLKVMWANEPGTDGLSYFEAWEK